MKILQQALGKIKSINKTQRDFFILLVQGLIGSAGKKTFRNLARYIEKAEHTFSRQMKKTFDFISLNTELIKSSKENKDTFIAVQDSSFIPKAGKKTYGLNFFWNGTAGKVQRGLEVDVIAVVKVNNKKEGYALSAEQVSTNSIPKSKRKKTNKSLTSKIDFSIDHVKKTLSNLAELNIKHMVADAFFAKEKYVNGVFNLGLHVISKLRKDARLLRQYTGPQKNRGRRRKFDKHKIDEDDFEKCPKIITDDGNIELSSCIAYSISLGRLIKLVKVHKKINGIQYAAEAFLFSTDLEMDAIQIYEFYVSRFQIEFVFRDAKNFTGLADCQSRDKKRIHYHLNASLTALNVIKIQDLELQKSDNVRRPFSMASWARKYHVEIIINRFISMFDLDVTFIKLHPNYKKFLELWNVNY